jgi:type I restriction enzyme S subunit
MMQQYYSVVKNPSAVWVNRLMIQPRIDSQYYRTDFVENEYKIEQIGCEKLGEIIERGDYGVLPDSEDYCEKGVPLIRGTNLRDLTIDDKEVIRVPKDYLTSKSEIQHRDILILIKGATIDAEWSVAIVPNIRESMIYNGSIFRVRVKTGYDPYYITAFMSTKYFLLQKTRAISNTGIYYNDKNSLENFMIAIPSPEIQKYIGDKVRRAEELREEAKRLENEINTFFNEKFSDIYNSIDESKVYHSKFTWKSAENIRDVFNAEYFTLIGDKYEQVIREQKGVYLDDLLKDCFMGKSPSQYADKGPKILKVKNLTNGGLDWSDSDHVDKEFYVKNKRCHLQHGDVFIIPAAHLAKYIGEKVDVYIQGIEGIKYPDAMASGKIIVIRPNFDKVNPIYLCLVMREKFVYHQIQRQVSGITASYYPKDVRQLCIPLIEREKQDMVADKYIEIIKCKEQAKQLIQEAKQDVEDLIEGDFEMSELNNNSSTESRC